MRKKIISIVFQAIDTINKQNEQDELIETQKKLIDAQTITVEMKGEEF